ncbi:TlpA disulfide reductase family protein [Sphingobacterium bovistauri]|uniref:AhpC/TSA family protein n=1 Tax=Sphingobacterium bovistauri TaxID=2781959 RepID=A0ABS7Z5S9_9SPHI|nr:TlpA disulfide reductase family protein [Sphingobacterium bovistauri]MCA5005543.1 AhpC/TSA family protein [Sphingobacterium bovistauri]
MNHKIFAYVFLLVSMLMSYSSYAQEQFTIKGQLKDPRLEGKEVYIAFKKEKFKSIITKGQFTITGTIQEPSFVSLLLNQDSIFEIAIKTGDTTNLILPSQTSLFIERGQIKVQGDNFTNIEVKGTKSNDEFAALKTQIAKTIKQRNLQSETDIQNLRDSLYLTYVEKNPTTIVAVPILMALNKTYFVSNHLDRLDALLPKLASSVQNRYGKIVANKIKTIREFGIGAVAPAFTVTSPEGKAISLADYKGEYVLVEFWAHYCIPCIKELPFLRESYDMFKDKKFNIIQISVDRAKDHEKWLHAVENHTSAWDNGIDQEDPAKAAKTAYGVTGIPANFLVDPQGKIVAIDLKGDNLKNTLKTLLN